jgi:hypothetical protein
MGLALLVLLFTAVAPMREDCGQCSATALCPVHVAAQAAAIKDLKPQLRAKDAKDRLATIQKLAQISAEHPTIPSSEASELIAGALEDDSYEVRTEAARLLGGELHPDVAVRSLVAAIDGVRSDLGKLGHGRGGGGGGGGNGGSGGGGNGGPDGDDGKGTDGKAAEQRKLREEMTKYAQTVIEGLGKLPDDRCVEALSDLILQLTRRNGGELIVPAAQSLVQLDARKGIESVIQKIKLSSGGGDSGGKWGPDTTGQQLHDLLARAVADKGLESAPAWTKGEQPDWDKWLARNQKRFPAKLGKYDVDKMRKARQ